MEILDRTLLGAYQPFSWPMWLVGAAIAIAVSIVLYNLLLHPLSSLPGPKLWAATPIPYTRAWLSGRMSNNIHKLHERYGDVVRVAPNRVSFAHPDAYNAIRGHRKAGHNEHGKDPIFYKMSLHNILGANRHDHARFRKILSHGFSARAMQDQQPLITRYIDLLMRRLQDLTNGGREETVTDIGAWFNFTTFDIIGDLSFGVPFGCLETSSYHPWVTAILHGVKEFGMLLVINWHFPNLFKLVKALSPWYHPGKHTDEQGEYARVQVAKRLSSGMERPDFIQALKNGAKANNGRPLTTEEMAMNARLLILAGSETTATALSATTYYLATHPRVHARLAEEVRQQFKSEDEIDFFNVNRLKYMLAVLDEAMRLFPPVPANLPRKAAKGGDVILGWQIPQDTGLEIWPWAVNHLSRNFTEPDKFIPERWLDANSFNGVEFDKSRHGALQPFSVGPRNCIGKNLAYVEMRVILARLIWNFDLALGDEGSRAFPEAKSYGLWIKKPLNIRLIPVEETNQNNGR
ncbi:putative cytochrome P450 pisatin demethylase-like protein [Cercophora samala]|uniref:Cytochrome P450 pisatin demethylase-like protein n=1 Tax=Cercophora samala TaxID=330535 RepID=A0AA40DDK5_9PEZI|nr:putative cytochrome P450 pisatin demethylase-like protein [Cercophora samala]